MNIVLVQATNWMSHVDSTLDPGDAQFLTIRGQHGVGKTALIEAVSYALFGRGRFDTADEPVRHGASDMSVRVEWLAPDGARYRVIRRRTTKAGGKGSLSFAVQRADASWTTLDGSTIRETEAEIRRVVGVDGPTFEAIAFLMQGRITALVEATAAGRRDVLVSGLILDRWPKLRARAAKAVAEAEVRLASKRMLHDRLAASLMAQSPGAAEAQLEADRGRLTAAETERAEAEQAVAEHSARARELDTALAGAERDTTELTRLQAEREEAVAEWHRAKAREDLGRSQVQRLEEAVAGEAEIAAAASAVPAVRARVDAEVSRESTERALARDLADVERAIRDLELPHQQAVANWRARETAAAARLAELRSHATAGRSVCESCGQAIDDRTAQTQLAAVEEALTALGPVPAEPAHLDGVRTTRQDIVEQLQALAWEPRALVAARDELSRLERLAARAEDVGRMREQLQREIVAIGEAHADRIRAQERGTVVQSQIAETSARIEAAGPLRDSRAAEAAALADAEQRIAASAELVRTLDREIAADEARVAELEARRNEVGQLRQDIEAGAAETQVDRSLVDLFADIPLQIIDASLPELEAEAQSLLDLLDPGSTVGVAGQRATVDGKRVLSEINITFQDAAGRRDVRMTSGGERVAVSVALSLGLRRVLARQQGAQLRTASIDEPDGMDREQRMALAHAIRGLIHAGDIDRAFLITHHEDLAEEGDAQRVISKNGHGSVLELVT